MKHENWLKKKESEAKVRREKQEEGENIKEYFFEKEKKRRWATPFLLSKKKGDCKNGNKFCFLVEKSMWVKRAKTKRQKKDDQLIFKREIHSKKDNRNN